jgi:hypothetical protein
MRSPTAGRIALLTFLTGTPELDAEALACRLTPTVQVDASNVGDRYDELSWDRRDVLETGTPHGIECGTCGADWSSLDILYAYIQIKMSDARNAQ